MGPREAILGWQRAAGNRVTSTLVQRLVAAARDGTTQAARSVPYQDVMERFFGESFADTRVATGRSDLGRAGAHAATIGDRVAFADDHPSKRVVAHELAHVVQNRRAASPRSVLPGPDNRAEAEAHRASQGIAFDGTFTVTEPGTALVHAGLKKWFKRLVKAITGGGGGGGGGGGALVPIANMPDEAQIEEHAEAYHRARFYHGTGKPFASYQEEGLDPKYAGTGASRVGGEYSGTTTGKVYITPDLATATDYGGNVMRPLLPPERTKVTMGSAHDTEHGLEKGGPGELTWDPHHRGASEQDTARYVNITDKEQRRKLIRPLALTTDEPIGPEHIVFDPDRDPSDAQLLIIGQHYPSGPVTDLNTLRENHRAARRALRVSIGSLDEL